MPPRVPVVTDLASTARVLARTGLLAPVRPDRLAGMVLAVARYGLTPATVFAAGAARHPDRVAVVDDAGETTYADIDRRSNAVAHAFLEEGVAAGDRLGLLARNTREFVVSTIALGHVGATGLRPYTQV